MNVGILGTGTLAKALARAWSTTGHHVCITGRDMVKAGFIAREIGGAVEAVAPADFAAQVDVVVVAVAWEGLAEALGFIGAPVGSLSGIPVIDCTNAVDYATGELKPESGSAAELVASIAPNAHVVKALHLFAGTSWPYKGPLLSAPVVAVCGDEPSALQCASTLITDLGAKPAKVGGLNSARQLEQAAGFVMRVVMAGFNPRFAVPDVNPTAHSPEPAARLAIAER